MWRKIAKSSQCRLEGNVPQFSGGADSEKVPDINNNPERILYFSPLSTFSRLNFHIQQVYHVASLRAQLLPVLVLASIIDQNRLSSSTPKWAETHIAETKGFGFCNYFLQARAWSLWKGGDFQKLVVNVVVYILVIGTWWSGEVGICRWSGMVRNGLVVLGVMNERGRKEVCNWKTRNDKCKLAIWEEANH